MKRRHQKEAEQVVTGIIDGSDISRIIVDCTPGGGKSALPIEVSRLISAGLADAFCCIVPRQTLQHQGELAFSSRFLKDLYHHDFTARASTNEINPTRGTNGFFTTYQALGVDRHKTVLREFQRRRYILIMDEFHHVAVGSDWETAIAPLLKLASYVMIMTGTMARGDSEKISFIPYRESMPDLSDRPGQAVIRYPRSVALKEKAVLPLEFACHDGAVKWATANGREIEYEKLSQAKHKDATAAIYTACDTKYAKGLIDMGRTHWLRYRHEVNRNAKMIVVCANIAHARTAAETLRRMGINSAIATSHGSAAAHRNIKRFRGHTLDALVGIGMFYEGFNCPPLTHIVSLTHIRSTPWIEQMVSRANRVDPEAGAYDSQRGYIFCPDDPLMRRIIQKIEAEQAEAALSNRCRHDYQRNEDGLLQCTKCDKIFEPNNQLDIFGEDAGQNGVIPMSSKIAGARTIFLGEKYAGPVTESEREDLLRTDIDRQVKRYAMANGMDFWKINAKLKAAFGKPRAQMTRGELERLKAHLNLYYKTRRTVNGCY